MQKAAAIQNGIVNLFVACALPPRARHIFRRNLLASLLNLACNREQRFKFVRDFGGGVVPLEAIDQVVVSVQMLCRCRTV
jgi:hypothetical protein